MHEFEEQPVVLDKEVPKAETIAEGDGHESMDLSKIQEKGESLLKTILPDGEAHVDKLGLAGNPEAQKVSGEYNIRMEELRARIREKMAISATVGMLLMGPGNALGSSLESIEKNPQSLSVELRIPSVNIVAEEPLLQPEATTITDIENIQEGETEPKKEIEIASSENSESSDEKELKELTEMASNIANACLGLEKDGCLATIINQPTAKEMMLDAAIPFRKGLKEIGSALSAEKMKDGERFGKVISGIFNLITDASLIHIGGKQVIQLAQMYRSYKSVSDINSAHSFYTKNKKEIDDVLVVVFKDSPEKKQAVEEVLVTLEKVGDSTKEAL